MTYAELEALYKQECDKTERLKAALKNVGGHVDNARAEGTSILGAVSKLQDVVARDFIAAHISAAGVSLKSATETVNAALKES